MPEERLDVGAPLPEHRDALLPPSDTSHQRKDAEPGSRSPPTKHIASTVVYLKPTHKGFPRD